MTVKESAEAKVEEGAPKVPLGPHLAAMFLATWGALGMIGGLLAVVPMGFFVATSALNEDRGDRWSSWPWLLGGILFTFLSIAVGRLALLVAEQIRNVWENVVQPEWRSPWWPPFLKAVRRAGWVTGALTTVIYGLVTALAVPHVPALLPEAAGFLGLGAFCVRQAWREATDQGTSSGGKTPMDGSS